MSTELMILPQAQQSAWLEMAVAKNSLVTDLTQAELNAQSLLLNIATNEHTAIDEALTAYRKAHAEMVETRKSFTSQIDAGIIQPLMAFEKRVDPAKNIEYITLANTSLALRKSEADKANKLNAVNQELASFKAHCTNEFFKVAAEYRGLIRAECTTQYQYWLQQKSAPTTSQLRNHFEAIPIPVVAKFKPILITVAQMSETYNTIHKPDFPAIFEEMMVEVENTFANFQSDLANVQQAIAAQQQATQLATLHDNQQLEEDTAINTLIATSEAVIVDTPKIKQTYSITIIESEAWAKAIMAGFISNLPALAKYIRVKSWSKLSIGQMAEYLSKLATDTETKIKGLEYESIER